MTNLSLAADALAWSLIDVLWQGLLLWALRLALDPLLPSRAVRLRYGLTAAALAAIPIWWLASLLSTLAKPAHPYGLSAARDLNLITTILVGIWAIGVLFSTLRIGGGLWRLHRIVSQATIVSAAWQGRFELLAQRVDVRRKVRLLASTLVDLPCALGWVHPVVLVPLSLFADFNTAQLQAILVHELVHVRRYDWLVGILQGVVESVLFHVPFVWLLSARLRQEREACCDDSAVEILGDRLGYATALVSLEATLHAPQLTLSIHGGSLVSRIRHLIDPDHRPRPRASAFLSIIILTATLSFASLATIVGSNDPIPTWLPSEVNRWAPELEQACKDHNLPPALLAIMTLVESGGDPQALSSYGATGLLQIMPATSRRIAEQRGLGNVDLNDPVVNLDFGAWYMAQQLETFNGDLKLAFAAYNGGPERAQRWSEGGEPLSPETLAYVKVLSQLWQERDKTHSSAFEILSKRRNLSHRGNMLHPLAIARVSQAFGIGPHRGVDLAAPKGTPILAPLDGEVISVSDDAKAGKAVVILHDEGLETRYHHLDAIDVVVGDELSAGEPLGRVGSTGVSTGPHLHFEVRENGVPVDPMACLEDLDQSRAE